MFTEGYGGNSIALDAGKMAFGASEGQPSLAKGQLAKMANGELRMCCCCQRERRAEEECLTELEPKHNRKEITG